MKRSRFSEEQIIGLLKEAEATTVKGTCAKYNISDAPITTYAAHLRSLSERLERVFQT